LEFRKVLRGAFHLHGDTGGTVIYTPAQPKSARQAKNMGAEADSLHVAARQNVNRCASGVGA
jgi:hypothetical protein